MLFNTVATSTRSQEPGITCDSLPHHLSSYAGILIPSRVSVELKGADSLNTCLQDSSLQRTVLERGDQTLKKSCCPRSLVFLNAPRKSDRSDPFSDSFCVSIAKPTLLSFFLVQTVSPRQIGCTSMLQTKVYLPHVVSMFL